MSAQPARKPWSFWKREDGSATTRSIMWLPVFIGFFCLVADVSLIFFKQTVAIRVVQDTNRGLSIGRLADEQAAEEFAAEIIHQMSPSATVDTTIDNGVIRTQVKMPANELDAVGWFDVLRNMDVFVFSQQMKEV